MSSLRIPTIRHLTARSTPCLRSSQRRWAQVHDVRFLARYQSSRVTDKYQDKLNQKAKAEGLKDVKELKEAYKDKIMDLRKKASVEIPTVPPTPPPSPVQSESSSPFPPPPPPPQPTLSSKKEGIKTLSSYLDIEKCRTLPAKELEAIWRLRHIKDPQSLCAVIPLHLYKHIESTAKKHPHFILPLPHEEQGAEIHFLQWTFPAPDTVTVLFTHLAEYKLRGEYSQPHTTITHHLELADSNEQVLLQGNVMEGRGVSVDQAKWLLMCLQKFYGVQGAEGGRRRLLEMFGSGDAGFRVEDLLEEAEKAV